MDIFNKKKWLLILIISISITIWSYISYKDYNSILLSQNKEDSITFYSNINELELKINKVITYIYGLNGFISSHLDHSLSNHEFNTYSREIQKNTDFIKNISIAPNNIQTFVYPLKGNELTLGHNLENDTRENVRNDVKQAMETKNIIISGPYELRQGGLGMIVRSPIFNKDDYWGLVNVVVNIGDLITTINIHNSSINYEISNDDGAFWKNSDFSDYNITTSIKIADDNWIIKGFIVNTLTVNNLHRFFRNLIVSFVFILVVSQSIIRISFNNFLLSKKIKDLIYLDILTSLPNRRALQISINTLIKNKTPFGLAFIDLDNFKDINDSLGHSAGDQMLQQIAERINENKDYKAFRWGGDEFIIIQRNVNEENFLLLIKMIVGKINIPIALSKEQYLITSSAGISFYPTHGNSMDEIIKLADASMYTVKNNGKNKVQVFNASIGEKISKEFDLERKLKKALLENELKVFYQPQYCIKANKIIGVEALLRWKDHNGDNIPPNIFIPIAEKSKLIYKIDEFVLKSSLEQIKIWESNNINLKIAVNISANHFTHDFKDLVLWMLKEYNVNSDMLELEITETLAITDFDKTKKLIDDISSTGINIALDDFGTGYSSLSYLSKLNISTLKIDQSFVSKMDTENSEYEIVKLILNITKVLNIKTVAEGVENKEQLKLLADLGCDFCQGYLFSKAVLPEDIETLYFENI